MLAMRGMFPALVIAAALGCAPGAEKKDESGAGGLLSGPYSISPASDGALICWQTVGEESGAVRFRAAGGLEWTEVKEGKAARFHAVRVSGLKAGTAAEVEVMGAGGAKLGALSFRTSPPRDAVPFAFFVYGDTRGNPSVHSRIASAMAAEAGRVGRYMFVMNTGDLATFGSDEERTAVEFFIPAAPLLAKLPLICVPGNHEMGSDLYGKYFPEQGVPRKTGDPFDVCVDYGPVRIVGIDQYAGKPFAGDRAKWLESKLSEAGDMWRIVMFHEPIYSSGAHGSAVAFRNAIEPILVKGRAHAVFAGHDHNYERTRPIKGVTHITAGSAGAPLRSRRGENAWSILFDSTYHYLTVEVERDKLLIKAFRPSNKGESFEKFDSFEIPKECGWPQGDGR